MFNLAISSASLPFAKVSSSQWVKMPRIFISSRAVAVRPIETTHGSVLARAVFVQLLGRWAKRTVGGWAECSLCHTADGSDCQESLATSNVEAMGAGAVAGSTPVVPHGVQERLLAPHLMSLNEYLRLRTGWLSLADHHGAEHLNRVHAAEPRLGGLVKRVVPDLGDQTGVDETCLNGLRSRLRHPFRRCISEKIKRENKSKSFSIVPIGIWGLRCALSERAEEKDAMFFLNVCACCRRRFGGS